MEKANQSWGHKLILGLQHLFAMFGATIVVPAITGLDPAVALFAAGGGTLLFHFITKRKVPVFLGSSFAFMMAIKFVVETEGKEFATGAIICAGACYLIFALITKLIGPGKIKRLFPAIVTGPVIIVIGLTLAPTVLFNDITADFVGGLLWTKWVVAASVVVTVVVVSICIKGFFKLLPILLGLVVGYIVAVILHFTVAVPETTGALMSFEPIVTSRIIELPNFHLPKFSWTAILLIIPISIATFMEHIGDITTNGSVVGKDFFKDPGLHRTLIGDGVATMFAGLIGGPANTTYGENTGVLAITKNYNPQIIRIAAIYAMVLSVIGYFAGFLQSIPQPVIGGMSIVLFGMIAAIGIRTMAEAKVDFTSSRNLLILSIVLIIGIGITVPINSSFSISGIALAAFAGIILNAVLPGKDKFDKSKEAKLAEESTTDESATEEEK
ncbi:MAG: uracil-xanthine permease [Clostridia bacterium]|jgi:uracil permease|nr:uracil-xanthine permease [Clostridia bacterium]